MNNAILKDKLEIISVDILDESRLLADELKYLNRSLGFASGWHYLLDWTWTIRHLKEVRDKKILDAGAGIGLLQWYLALHSANVISADRSLRNVLPFHLLQHFNMSPFTSRDQFLQLNDFLKPTFADISLLPWLKALLRGSVGALYTRSWKHASGTVWLYRKDLSNLADVPSNTLDYIVSISALEHNSPNDLRIIVKELERTLKPGGAMILTLSAARDADWYFEPAAGWCYSEASLRDIFELPNHSSSNYDQFDELMEKLKNSKELRSIMTWYYYYSPRSGMPWGIWRPRYQPVGIVKVKPL